MSLARKLRTRMQQREIIVVPGIYDALSAYRTEAAGFEAVFASGSSLAATHLARPDIGLLSLTETSEIVGRITERISIPLLVDVDQGFGNDYTVARTVRLFERAGVAALQMEDQLEVKAADAPLSRPLVGTETMVGKIKAARDALVDQDIIISARSDAMSSEGFGAAMDRAHAYAEAGADMIFVESLTRREQMEELVRQLGGDVPLLHNLLRCDDEVTDATMVEEIGYSVALFPAVTLSAVGQALDDSLGALKTKPRLNESGLKADRIGAAEYLK
ncbi:isocitrate lyase/PEP mutase family protein [uncultured Parasphingorhabdus sp.]|uniref:isocitrate lyase/PEP mutase family protein n=1 Tax=uncultured Parasphingorhabdus sp. TaxID=2709694 RepID=UPI002AA81B7C|nr:isocitrate lyase/PEP mutase family protein [uncultured Parasphingorhabdus sp.]